MLFLNIFTVLEVLGRIIFFFCEISYYICSLSLYFSTILLYYFDDNLIFCKMAALWSLSYLVSFWLEIYLEFVLVLEKAGYFGVSLKLGMANLDLLLTIWNKIRGLLYLFSFFALVFFIKFWDFANCKFFL